MDIWFAANIPQGSSGGVARSMHGFAEGLRLLGHRTTIVLNGSSYLLFALKLTIRLFLHKRHAPDWIIARSTDGVGCAFLIKALALKTRIAIQNHGWEEYTYEIERRLPLRLIHPQTTWKARMLRFPLLRLCLAFSACCISGTISEIRWLKRKYPRHHNKLRYAPNGVEVFRAGYWMGRDDIPLNILAIGSFTWKKNLDHTVDVYEEIAKHLPESRFFLIGTGFEKKLISRQLLQGMTIIPDVKPSAMSHWYTTCPYLISSSRYEGGHSFALLEALSYGCIVCASAIPSSMEIIKNGYNGLLISGVDVKNDAAAIADLLKEKEQCAAMRRHAFSSAGRNRWERQAKRMERILCMSR